MTPMSYRRGFRRCISLVVLALAMLAVAAAPAAETAPKAEDLELFEKKIRPVLAQHCYECHGEDPEDIQGGFVLIHREGLRKGGDSGEAIVPGEPEKSRLVKAIRYEDEELQMPPNGKLPDAAIADIIEWIERGAPDPRRADPKTIKKEKLTGLTFDYSESRKHWAYQAMGRPEPPVVKEEAWVGDPLDRFVLAKLEAAGLKRAARADRRTLIRRTTFDLVGLPPTEEEINDFLADESPDAFARVVDRLLSSPHYGERWGRYWLDVARYADSNGLDENIGFPNAWRYRDYVIRAFNQDKPYDVFVTEQLAGDLMPGPAKGEEYFDRLTATGFLVLGAKVLAEPDSKKMNLDIVDEQLDVVGKAFMAQTLGCARCHDHKFDPVSSHDYYALAGIFKSTEAMTSYKRVAKWRERELADEETIAKYHAYQDRLAAAKAELEETTAAANSKLQIAWRKDVAKYMLSASEVVAEIEPREAEDFSQSNLKVDREELGVGIGVVFAPRDAEGQMMFVEWKVEVPTAGKYRIELRYASRRPTAVKMLLNGKRIKLRAAAKRTGNRRSRPNAQSQKWFDEGVYEFQAGENILRLEGKRGFPTIDQYAVTAADEDAPVVVQTRALVDEYELEPAVFDQWVNYLRDSERRGDPVMLVWHTFADLFEDDLDQQDETAQEIVSELREELAAVAEELVREAQRGKKKEKKTEDDDEDTVESFLASSLLGGLAPTSLDDLAGRYQTLFATIDRAYQERLSRFEPAREDQEFSEEEEDELERARRLPDVQQEQVRRFLYSSEGPFAAPSGLEKLYDKSTREQVVAMRGEVEEMEEAAPTPLARAMAVTEGVMTDLPVHIRGDYLNLAKEEVPRGILRLADHLVAPPTIDPERSGRLELARWLTDPEHPLTARVMVNRIWQGHFGVGIVASSSNFGLRGEQPSHAKLLDYLAREFIAGDWSIKAMHRRILLSSTYQMSSTYDEAAAAVDTENRLLWRMNRRRLEAEPLRDALMAMGGKLDLTVGGGLFPKQSGYIRTNSSELTDAYTSGRRAVYMPIIRTAIYSMFASFDYADPSVHVARRPSTVVAPQALFMMNSPLVVEQAERFARRLLTSEPADEHARIEAAYVKAYGRPPTSKEMAGAVAFLAKMRRVSPQAVQLAAAGEAPTGKAAPGDGAVSEKAGEETPSEDGASDVPVHPVELFAWKNLCHVILASSEFMYVN